MWRILFLLKGAVEFCGGICTEIKNAHFGSWRVDRIVVKNGLSMSITGTNMLVKLLRSIVVYCWASDLNCPTDHIPKHLLINRIMAIPVIAKGMYIIFPPDIWCQLSQPTRRVGMKKKIRVILQDKEWWILPDYSITVLFPQFIMQSATWNTLIAITSLKEGKTMLWKVCNRNLYLIQLQSWVEQRVPCQWHCKHAAGREE